MANTNPVPTVSTPLTLENGQTNQQWWTFWARLQTAVAAGGGVTLETNGALNALQTLLNLIAGPNITLTADPAGGVTIAATNILAVEKPAGAMDGVNLAFTIAHAVAFGWILLMLNGVYQEPGIDYVLTGKAIAFTVAPKASDYALEALYLRTSV